MVSGLSNRLLMVEKAAAQSPTLTQVASTVDASAADLVEKISAAVEETLLLRVKETISTRDRLAQEQRVTQEGWTQLSTEHLARVQDASQVRMHALEQQVAVRIMH
jgi:hypothetical protein